MTKFVVSANSPSTPSERRALAELVYIGRKTGVIHPYGGRDSGGKWYPNGFEGGLPDVKKPSKKNPDSYLKACKKRKWCLRLPEGLLQEEAKEAARHREVVAAWKTWAGGQANKKNPDLDLLEVLWAMKDTMLAG